MVPLVGQVPRLALGGKSLRQKPPGRCASMVYDGLSILALLRCRSHAPCSALDRVCDVDTDSAQQVNKMLRGTLLEGRR